MTTTAQPQTRQPDRISGTAWTALLVMLATVATATAAAAHALTGGTAEEVAPDTFTHHQTVNGTPAGMFPDIDHTITPPEGGAS